MATTNLDNKTITIEYDAEVPQSVCKAASVLPFFVHIFAFLFAKIVIIKE